MRSGTAGVHGGLRRATMDEDAHEEVDPMARDSRPDPTSTRVPAGPVRPGRTAALAGVAGLVIVLLGVNAASIPLGVVGFVVMVAGVVWAATPHRAVTVPEGPAPAVTRPGKRKGKRTAKQKRRRVYAVLAALVASMAVLLGVFVGVVYANTTVPSLDDVQQDQLSIIYYSDGTTEMARNVVAERVLGAILV